MGRRKDKNHFVVKIYTDKELKDYLESELQSEFEQHCDVVANTLNVHRSVVEDVVKDMAFQILKKAQSEIINKRKVKINIYGFLFMVTDMTNDKLKFTKIKKS